jgi:hypothetical protein
MQVQSTNVAATCKSRSSNSFGVAPKKAVREVLMLNRVNLRHLIDRQNGLFLSVDYRKIGGEKRTLTGRLGVKSYLKGGQNNVEKDERPYLTVFDIKLCQYRTVSLDTVSEIRMGGKIYKVID